MEQPSPTGSSALIELDLFPLNVVLYPGMPLPLHIFEERYKKMIRKCLDQEGPFGVILIKEGQEVGPPADPFRVGTTARIIKVQTLDDGRTNILTTGERRFEVVDIIQREPALAGLVQYLPEELGDNVGSALSAVQEHYATFLRNLGSLAGGWTGQVNITDDAIRLSYAIAAGLELPNQLRQKLLEISSASERLEQLAPLLQRANEMLQKELIKRNPFQGPRLN